MSLTLILAAAAAAASPTPNDYGLGQNWLCRPGRRDACSTPNLDVSDIATDGSVTIRKSVAMADPKADCFYVYPTLSYDEGGNSDMIANDEERRVVETQFARFREQCRNFAPLYRQSTLTWLRSNMAGKPIPVDLELRYTDVRDAWRHYLANDNKGRPFVLVGHSQGSGLLKRLVAEEVDGKPEQKQMLSAMLAGHNVVVADGKDTGGDFKSVPLCRRADQTGCAIAWVTFRTNTPPPANARFGRTDKAGMAVACTNPAQLAGGNTPFRAVLPATKVAGDLAAVGQPWTRDGKAIATRFVALPGLYSGQCVSQGGASYLAATINVDPADGRVDDPGGDVKVGPAVLTDWGLHLLDVNVVLGDMVALVGTQTEAWVRANPR